MQAVWRELEQSGPVQMVDKVNYWTACDRLTCSRISQQSTGVLDCLREELTSIEKCSENAQLRLLNIALSLLPPS